MKEINKNIEGYNVDGICVGCLNYNRKMFQLEEVIECFKILGNIDVSDGITLQVCWECLANIKSTMRFKEQIKNSINVLLKYSKMHTSLNAPEDLSQFATQRLSIHKTTIYSHPNLEEENKITSDCIKIEIEEYVNEFDESGLDIKAEDCVHEDSNYQENDLSPDRVSPCDDIEPSNLQYSQMLTFSDEPEDSSRCKAQWLKKDKTIIHSYPNIKQEEKEHEENVNELDQSGLDIEVEVPAYEDSNNQENDHSPDSMSSDDDMLLSKLQSERNTWKRKLEDKKSKKIETEIISKDKKIPRRLINLPSELGELYTITESNMAETSSADVASDQHSVTSLLLEPDPTKKKKRRTNAQRQKEYRLRKKLEKQLDNNSACAEVIPMQEGPTRSSILKPKSAKRKLPDEIEQKRKILNQIRCRRYRERKKMRKKASPEHRTPDNRIIDEEILYFML